MWYARFRKWNHRTFPASSQAAAQMATWFISDEITAGSRSIGAAALPSASTVVPSTTALDVSTDPIVAAVRSVPVVRGRYVPGYLDPADQLDGVDHPMILADDLEALAPEMVHRFPVFDEDGNPQDDDLVVNQSMMIAALVATIQDLTARVEALEGP